MTFLKAIWLRNDPYYVTDVTCRFQLMKKNVTRLSEAMDAAAAREQTNMADFTKANIQLQQSFSKLQETLRPERNQSVELQQRLNRTIVDQQRRIENLEKETVDHNTTSKAQQQRIVELERVESNYNETILCQQQKITELEKDIVDHKGTKTVQQQRIDELDKTDINHNETITDLQQTINELANGMIDHNRNIKIISKE